MWSSDEHALVTRLFQLNNEKVYRFLLHVTCNRAVAEDLLGDTFLRTCQARPTLMGLREEQQRSWLITTALHLAYDHHRRDERRADGPIPEQPDPVDRFDQANAAIDARRALARLTYEHREVLALYYVVDLPIEEIARVLQLSETAVTTRLGRAREAFKRGYGKGGRPR
jgi:RNA polymerase sigma-70 factor (ECF subfamily)